MKRTFFRFYGVGGWRHPLVAVSRGGSNVDATGLGRFLESKRSVRHFKNYLDAEEHVTLYVCAPRSGPL